MIQHEQVAKGCLHQVYDKNWQRCFKYTNCEYKYEYLSVMYKYKYFRSKYK